MKVNFPKITYTEVKEKRKQALESSCSLHGLMEQYVHYLLKRFPFLVVFALCAKFMINNCFFPAYLSIYQYFAGINETNLQHWFTNDLKTLLNMTGSFIISGGVTAIPLIFGYKILFLIVNKLLPRKTPVSDRAYQNGCFWRESENVEEALRVINEISKLSADDIAYSDVIIEEYSDKITLLLKDSQYGLITKQTYSVSYKPMMEKLKNSGELDFSFVDEKWNELICKFQMETI